MTTTHLTWQGALEFDSVADSQHHLRLDGDKVGGPSPMELVLMALGGCTGMDVISILRKKRADVRGFEVKLDAERATEHPQVYTGINIVFIVRGKNVPAADIERAVELSVTKYCSVMMMLQPGVPINTRYEYEETLDEMAGIGSIETAEPGQQKELS